MTNSFFNFQEAADFASQLQQSYDDINRGFERAEQLERENDRTREINAAMPMKMIESLADFSITVKRAADKMKEDRYDKLKEDDYRQDDPEKAAVTDSGVRYMVDNLPGFREAQKTAIDNEDVIAQKILKNSPHGAFDDKMATIQGVYNSIPHYWQQGGFAARYQAATDPQEQSAIIQQFKDNLTVRNPILKKTNKYLIKNTVERGVDDFLVSIRQQGVQSITAQSKAEYESVKNRKLLEALNPNNSYTEEDYKKDYAFEFDNGMGGVSHDIIKRAFSIAKVSSDVSTDQVKQLMKMDAGNGMTYEQRFPVIAGQMHKDILAYEKQQATADADKKTLRFESTNEAALTYAREQLAEGEDVEVIKRNLLQIQGNNRLEFAKENPEIDTFIEGLDQSASNYIETNADFEDKYTKGQLTVEEVEATGNFDLIKKWQSRAQTQEKARTDKNYKDSRSAVEQLVKAESSIYMKSSRGSLLPHANAVRGALVQKYESEFTRLVDAGDPNAAVNAALTTEQFWIKNGGGQTAESDEDGRLFVVTNGKYQNYMDSISPSTARKNTQSALTFDLYSTAVKLEMADNNIQQALDTPNVFLSEVEVMEEIKRLASREGYSPKLKAMGSLYGKSAAVGGVRGILERQAAVYGIPKENIPEELKSISEIYSQGDPFINCLIREKGFEGLSTNQLLRQCAVLSDKGTDDEELEITKRAAFQ